MGVDRAACAGVNVLHIRPFAYPNEQGADRASNVGGRTCFTLEAVNAVVGKA